MNKNVWRSRPFIICCFVLLALIISGMFAVKAGKFYNPTTPFVGGKLQPPSASFWLGTDELGRDVFSRLLDATGVTLGLALISVVLAMVTGTLLGMVAGYDVLPIATPVILFIGQISVIFPVRWLPLIIVLLFGEHAFGMMMSMFFSLWGQFLWLIYDEARALKGRAFIQAAYMSGGTRWGILKFHVLPYMVPTVLVLATLSFRTAIGVISTLSFLGIGLQPPTPTWGSMISEAQPYFFQAWWLVLFPLLALVVSVLAINWIGHLLGRKWSVSGRAKLQKRGDSRAKSSIFT
ncbi:ABC transporter permease [Alicyclobacillus fodiniaquatilis]|jgi:peptide/nickel transport system permease protein|uniref:ABC transporter permease n=1 Tax=Alicyclobacillus fodiniaquatilis TaxID=1661150 RepID=A0ABW4JPY6_9BACL